MNSAGEARSAPPAFAGGLGGRSAEPPGPRGGEGPGPGPGLGPGTVAGMGLSGRAGAAWRERASWGRMPGEGCSAAMVT